MIGKMTLSCECLQVHSPSQKLTGETLASRPLKYAAFISGDGNFHLQLQQGKGNAKTHPSMFGDGGCWSNQDTFDAYIERTRASPKEDQEKVSVMLTGRTNLCS